MDYSIIITAWKEADTVKEILEKFLNKVHGNYLDNIEIVLVCPDIETLEAGDEVTRKYYFKNLVKIKDPQKGKPFALNLALHVARGKILIFTDGDVVIDAHALPALVQPLIEDKENKVGAVTGRPISKDSKVTMFGYFGNLLADAAHDKRTYEFNHKGYYFVSGYLYATRKIENLYFPEKTLIDDAWITVKIREMGYTIKYVPEAKVLVKYPKNFSDWLRQKKRSIGGYGKLEVNEDKLKLEKRDIFQELKYILFPIRYARNFRELLYSLALYPARLFLWIAIWWNNYVVKKGFKETWVRIESTK